MPEYVKDGQSGRVVSPDDVDAMARALDEALSLSEENFQERSAAARTWAETLEWQKIALRYLELYRA
jgi:glycosyltransferase involved in cell wall biosynthesis